MGGVAKWGPRAVLAGLFALVLLAVAVLTVMPRAVVDWRRLRVIVLESDDWGLAGFVPGAGCWEGLDRQALGAGHFPPVYWESTLEDAALVRRLSTILAAHRGRDGLPAVLQPNYVMASLDWDAGAGVWRKYELPHWAPRYARPGLWEAVTEARAMGVWYPEFHAHLHYDPERRRQAALSTDLAREVTARGSSLFPGSEHARELAPWRPAATMAAELDASLRIFGAAFGRGPGSVIAPDYHWHDAIEDMWDRHGLRVIQAKREQRNPEWGAGNFGRVVKYGLRQWARVSRPGRIYLERNIRLEPVQAENPEAIVAQCVADTREAWRRGEPAIVETHRVNFAHADPAVTATGLRALESYLAGVAGREPAPVFLCDTEIAQLARRGTSWRVAGDRLILRNGSRATRILVVPHGAVPTGQKAGETDRIFRLAAGQTLVIPLS